jgi:hypothetical protein
MAQRTQTPVQYVSRLCIAYETPLDIVSKADIQKKVSLMVGKIFSVKKINIPAVDTWKSKSDSVLEETTYLWSTELTVSGLTRVGWISTQPDTLIQNCSSPSNSHNPYKIVLKLTKLSKAPSISPHKYPLTVSPIDTQVGWDESIWT